MKDFGDISVKMVWLGTALAVAGIMAVSVLVSLSVRPVAETPVASVAVTPDVPKSKTETKESAQEVLPEADATAASDPYDNLYTMLPAKTLKLWVSLPSRVKKAGDRLPLEYTCHRGNKSPPLAWSGAPKDTKSYVLFMEKQAGVKPDVRWILFNIGSHVPSLREDLSPKVLKSAGVLHARADNQSVSYSGPCDPQEKHIYVFRLFALDTLLTLSDGAAKADLLAAMKGHVLDTAVFPVTHFYRQ